MRDTNSRRSPTTFLGRLARDRRGNTLALAAMAVFPLLGMIGSGLDMGRAYLVKARLQQACDAGVLAARKSMTGTTLDTAARTQATSFFNINLNAGPYPANADGTPGTGPHGSTVQPIVVSDVIAHNAVTGTDIPTGTVHGVAAATVPMTIMKLFGTDSISLNVTCEAELNVSNQDILFVLDTTGSMACLPGDSVSTCDSYVGSNTTQSNGIWLTREKDNSRIDVLRAAVKSFYAAVNNAKAPGSRLRIGFLPYSSGVNVGDVLPSGTLDNGLITYASRLANFSTSKHSPSVTSYGNYDTVETYNNGTALNAANCTSYTTNQAFSGYNPTAGPPTSVITGGNTPANVTTYEYKYNSGKKNNESGTATCKRDRRTVTTTYTTRWAFTNWTYTSARSMPVANYVAGSQMIVPALTSTSTVPSTGSGTPPPYSPLELADMTAAGSTTGMTAISSAWDGCIEERITGSADINGAANSASTRWRPAWRDIEYSRTAFTAQTTSSSDSGDFYRASQDTTGLSETSYSCPKAAALPEELSAAQVGAYVDAPDFVAHGRTYHDIGMIWAARIMSTTSVFSALHSGAPNGKPISRNIIFMTDGDMKPTAQSYSPYGIEKVDRRVMGPTATLNDTTLKTAHNARFLAACQAAQDNGVNVWVVAFGQTMTTELRTCASSDTQAYEALNAASLNSALAQIAQRIADLRLTS
ncbi:TadE/TadG family type IV pilus assembly protein [Sphingomonas endolithica]|uniref:TadE/TadG family type IV pilus assembly protein n=1 Tax=Sphingomonas endolithica TaxID=2972485 RepID=UPI0021AED4E8|nr:TadE/TadG family type IV pilus assembly protein [Sphingomonas sp. ZFBP2030]